MTENTENQASDALCARVVELRKQRSLTLEQLAAASGVSRSMLSQIERGKANPTLGVAHRIAQAFSMTIGELIDEPGAKANIDFVSGQDSSMLFRDDDACQIRTLSPLHLENRVEFYKLCLAPGAELASAPHYKGTRELLTVSEGCAEVSTDGNRLRLEAGDSSHYRADLPHCIANPGTATLVAFLVVTTQ